MSVERGAQAGIDIVNRKLNNGTVMTDRLAARICLVEGHPIDTAHNVLSGETDG